MLDRVSWLFNCMIDIMCSTQWRRINTTFDPGSWSLFYTNLESIEFYSQSFAIRLVVLASGRWQGLTFYICRACQDLCRQFKFWKVDNVSARHYKTHCGSRRRPHGKHCAGRRAIRHGQIWYVPTDSTDCCRCNYTGQAQGYQAATADAMGAKVSQGEEEGLEDLWGVSRIPRAHQQRGGVWGGDGGMDGDVLKSNASARSCQNYE